MCCPCSLFGDNNHLGDNKVRISEAPEASMISFDDYGVNRRVFVVVDGQFKWGRD